MTIASIVAIVLHHDASSSIVVVCLFSWKIHKIALFTYATLSGITKIKEKCGLLKCHIAGLPPDNQVPCKRH